MENKETKQKQTLRENEKKCLPRKFYSTSNLKLVVFNYEYQSINHPINLKLKTKAKVSLDWNDVMDGKWDDKNQQPEDLAEAFIKCHSFFVGSSLVMDKKNLKAIKEMLEERKPSEICKAIKGISNDPWPDRKKYNGFKHIAKSFDRWLTMADEVRTSQPGGYGEWRDEGYATRQQWLEQQDEIEVCFE